MNDLISKQDAVTLPVMPKRCRKYQTNNLDDAYEQGWEDLQKCIERLPSAQPERTEYIPETKAIPSERECVDLSEKVTATFYDDEHEDWSQKTVTIRDVLDSVCDEYTILPSAQQWIPCSERLPDQNGKYLVVGRRKAINILKFDGGRWYGKWGVVAWMPLPKPYREEVSD